jgi:hypothetical protein
MDRRRYVGRIVGWFLFARSLMARQHGGTRAGGGSFSGRDRLFESEITDGLKHG